MCAVQVVAPPEEGGIFVQEHVLNGPQVRRQAIDCLGHVVVLEVDYFAGHEFRAAAVHIEHAVPARLLHPSHVDAGKVNKADGLPHPVGDFLKVGVQGTGVAS